MDSSCCQWKLDLRALSLGIANGYCGISHPEKFIEAFLALDEVTLSINHKSKAASISFKVASDFLLDDLVKHIHNLQKLQV